jgi:clan AA aspartic protease (TIGR02281 family)
MRIAFASAKAPVVTVRLAGPLGVTRAAGLVDTGASEMAVPRELAEALGYDLAAAPVAEVRTVNGIIHVPAVALDEVTVGDASVRDVAAV